MVAHADVPKACSLLKSKAAVGETKRGSETVEGLALERVAKRGESKEEGGRANKLQRGRNQHRRY